MQRFLIVILLTSSAIACFAQIESIPQKDSTHSWNELITWIETPPKFPGGEDSLWCFIESNLDFQTLNNGKHQGRILSYFVIDTTGKVINIETNPEFTQKLSIVLNDSVIETEIKRVLNLLPDWSPGIQRDKPVRVKYSIPFKIPYTDFRCKTIENLTAVYWKVEKPAQFRFGGEKETKKSIEKFVGKNGIWPSQDDCYGKVNVRVLINEQGELSDYMILRGLDGCQGFNEEALRLVRMMPNWVPAEINGKPAKSYTVIPISFILR